jgi:Tol biopolymer transport system component
MIAFSMNRFEMLYNSSGAEPRAVFDGSADVALFDARTNEISTCPELSRKDRIETMPGWSGDGRFLYFCSAEKLPENRFHDLRCDLMRIEFDPHTKTFGRLDTVLTATQAGGSVLQPRMSPNGRFILVNISPYGDFPIDKAGTRLAIIDVATSALRTLDPDCRWTDSWHGWSSSGRWIVFTSKRPNGRFSAICFRYVDSTGAAHDPFVLPQKEPAFYESSIFAFNVPECLTARIPVTISQCRTALQKYGKKPGADAVTAASARQGAYGDN